MLAIIIVAVTAAADVKMTQGLTLLVVSIPYSFANLPTGEVFGLLVMMSIMLASLAAMIALVEPMVSILRREMDMPRHIAMAVVALTLWLSASFALANPVARLTIDSWLVPVMVPMVLGLTAVFAAWRVPRPILRGEKYRERFTVFYLWFIITRWVTPALCLALSIFAIMRVAL